MAIRWGDSMLRGIKIIFSCLILLFVTKSYATSYLVEARWYVDGKYESSGRINTPENEWASVRVENKAYITYLEVLARRHDSASNEEDIELNFEVGRHF